MTAAQLEVIEPGRQIEPSAAPSPPELLARAFAQSASPEILAKFMDLHDRWKLDQRREAFDAALAAAQAELPAIIKNREVDFTSSKGRTHYKHEDLGEIVKTIRPILGKHGISFRFRTASPPGEPISVTCIISRGGYSEENTLIAPRDDTGNKNGIQAIGSTVSYLQRYTLKAALGLAAAEDDDGRGGNGSADPITPAQLDKLKAAVVQVAVPIGKVLGFAKVERLELIPQRNFEKVLGAVWRWRPTK